MELNETIAFLVHRLLYQQILGDEQLTQEEHVVLERLMLYGFVYYDPTRGQYALSNLVPATDGKVCFVNKDTIVETAQRVLDGPLPCVVPYNRHISAWGQYPVYSGANGGRMQVFTVRELVLPLPPDAENCLRSTGAAVLYVERLGKHLLITRHMVDHQGWVVFELTGIQEPSAAAVNPDAA